MDQNNNLLEMLFRLLGGDVSALDQAQPPPVAPQQQVMPPSLKDRMAGLRFPPRRPDDLSGMGY
jgi:hypothetical protein